MSRNAVLMRPSASRCDGRVNEPAVPAGSESPYRSLDSPGVFCLFFRAPHQRHLTIRFIAFHITKECQPQPGSGGIDKMAVRR